MKYHRIRGFTLLEVLVALVILAIALAAVIKTTSENAKNTRYLRDKTFAHWVAMNIWTEIQAYNKWPDLGEQSGSTTMGKQEWFWHTEVSTTPDKELRRLDIRVYYSPTDVGSLVTLTGFVKKSYH